MGVEWMLVACEWEELNSNHLLVSWEVIKRSNKLLFEWTNLEQSFKFNGNLSPHNCLWNFLLRYLRHFHKFSPSLTSTRKTLMIHKKISVFTTRRYSKIIGNKVFIPIVLGIRTSFFSFKLDVTEIFFPIYEYFAK